MSQFWKALCTPGTKAEVIGVAPTQHVYHADSEASSPVASTENIKGLELKPKQRLLDRCLDKIVGAAGSQTVFSIILLVLLAWAFSGIHFGKDVNWQVLISDVQAILCYIFDSLLMRQQLNSYDDSLTVAAQLQSRAYSHVRMLDKVQNLLEMDELTHSLNAAKKHHTNDFAADLPRENWFARVATRFSICAGHIVTIIGFWAAIAVWLSFGPSNGWSDEWQLYINSATSALMIFVFAFLANIREQHSVYSKKCIDATFKIDSALERKLRRLTDDHLANDAVVIPAPKFNVVQRAIYYYADVVGTLFGIVLLIIVIAAWLAIGPLLSFNSNWWLIIGTYAGLIGLNDGFVLLHVQSHSHDYETVHFEKLDRLDELAFAKILQPLPEKDTVKEDSLSFKLSLKMSVVVGRFCAHEIAFLVDVLFIIGLLIGSSLMQWDTTGQLLSNVPPSIVETFLMIILLPGHNLADTERRVQIQNLYERRLKLIAVLDTIDMPAEVDTYLTKIKKFEEVTSKDMEVEIDNGVVKC